MKIFSVCSFFMFLLNPVLAQELKEPKYPELLEKESTLIQSGYNYTVERIDYHQYIFKAYWDDIPDIAVYSTYDYKDLTTLHGPYAIYNEDRSINAKGEYDLGERNGMWQEANNKKGNYQHGKKTGEWITYRKDGSIIRKENYDQGELQGAVIDFDSSGKETNKVVYDQGKISSGKEILKDKVIMPSYADCDLESKEDSSFIKCSHELINQYIGNIKYPSKARNEGIQGKVLIRFTVDSEGMVKDIMPVRPAPDIFIDLIVDRLKQLPVFTPASENGVKLSQWLTLSRIFKLES